VVEEQHQYLYTESTLVIKIAHLHFIDDKNIVMAFLFYFLKALSPTFIKGHSQNISCGALSHTVK